ncbi:hypothetical protein WK68_13855 [Burkholderia ubonensis]|uniref:hypothetical protein n=1 Tax=Burkholderia ubonensis TaxID=101571 RepID=UPI00075E0CF5|nr:hypothetical protein [Burkholderia ubonensis]KVU39532.1 hypothetical protein WK68_13855 [Burkholderia ubonensis]
MSTCTAPARRDAVSPLHRWLAIAVLAVATFTIVVTEFAPIGLLSSIAADLHARPATVGVIASAYAWIGAGSALLSAVLPNHFPRKPLLIGLITFIEPYLRQMPGVAPAAVALLLFGFGAAGLLGNVLTGLAIDQHFKTVIVAALAFMCAALIGLGWLVPRAGGAAAIPASALYTTVFNGASGIGAMPGASILARSGLSAVMLAAGGGVACAACLVVAASPEGKA